MEKEKDYRQFDLEDFVTDDQFIDWAQGRRPEKNEFWEEYLQANPAQQQNINQAKAIVAGFKFEEPLIEDDFFTRLNGRINQSIGAEETLPRLPVKDKNYRLLYRAIAGIAAAVLLILAFVFYPRTIVIENGYAGIKTVVLPDSSVVILNANSSLSYPEKWDKQNREVQLQGEGFFSIRHLTSNSHVVPFRVHAGELNLHVLGTSFNVNNRTAQVEVILKTGRLKVTHGDQEVFMKPADGLTYNQEKGTLTLKKVKDCDYTDWTRLEYIFNDLSMERVAQKLEYFYGIKINFEDDTFKNEKLSGRLGLSSLGETIETLELLLHKNIEVKDKQVTISR